MAVTTTNVFSVYTATGASNVFNIGFYVQQASWLLVKVNDVSQPFSAALNTDQDAAPGGTVTLLIPLVGAGATVRVERHTPLTQLDVFQPYTPFPAQTVEFDFDKAICIMQELAYQLSLIAFPAISPSTAGQFLTNDGISTLFWADVIPKPYLMGGFVTSPDGVTLGWGAGGGGGGGGINVIGPTTTPTANAAIISGVGSNVLQLGVGDENNAGLVSKVKQRVAGLKVFQDEASTRKFDIRAFGAVPDDDTVDAAQAIYNGIAAFTQSQFPNIENVGPAGGLVVPEGTNYISCPIALHGSVDLGGITRSTSRLKIGPGGGGKVQPFAGQMIYVASPSSVSLPNPNMPTYGPPLVGGVGQSLRINFGLNAANLWLHDANPFTGWIGNVFTLTSIGFQLYFQLIAVPPAGVYSLVTSMGPRAWGLAADTMNLFDAAWGFFLVSDGVNAQVRTALTTSIDYDGVFKMVPQGLKHYSTSGNITPGTAYNVELNYDGTFMDSWLGPVGGTANSFGHVATGGGPVVKTPWEGTSIGRGGMELQDYGWMSSVDGYVDSFRVSNIARHTGVGSFSVPAAKYTFDGNTMALYNWDQGLKTIQPKDKDGGNVGPLLTLPFVLGQVTENIAGYGAVASPAGGSPMPHYIRCTGAQVSPDCSIHDIGLIGNWQGGGITVSNSWRCLLQRIYSTQTTKFGIQISTGVSFFTFIEDCTPFWAMDIGLQLFGVGSRIMTQGGGIGAVVRGGGILEHFYHQPAYDSWCTTYWDSDGGGGVSVFEARDINNDAEAWDFLRQLAPLVLNVSSSGSFRSQGSFYDAESSNSVAPIYFITPPSTQMTFREDFIRPNNTIGGTTGRLVPSLNSLAFQYRDPGGQKANFDNCNISDGNFTPLPFSNIPGWAVQFNEDSYTNFAGLSISDQRAYNLAGTVDVSAGYTVGEVIFDVPEVDNNYQVILTPQGYLGSAPPAAGSTRVNLVEKRTDGFTIQVEVDPGGDDQVTFGWSLFRTLPPAGLFIYLPTIPSNVANPFAGEVNQAFAFGITVKPASGSCILTNGAGRGAIVSSGNPVGAANSWSMEQESGGTFNFEYFTGASAFEIKAFVARNGKIANLLNPGGHNLIWYFDGTNLTGGMDGAYLPFAGGGLSFGTQPANIYFGERQDGSALLGTMTLKNFKMDRTIRQVVSGDSSIGPGLQDEGLFIGGGHISGVGSTTIGGFTQQIINAKYGTTYYWMCCNGLQDNVLGQYGLLEYLWKPWHSPAFNDANSAAVVLMGWEDLLLGTSATNIWDAILVVLEGGSAIAAWTPPVRAPPAAFAFVGLPSSGSANYTFNGTVLNIPFNTDSHTTALNMVAAMAASGPINAQFVGSVYSNDPALLLWNVQVNSRQPGAVGNTYTLACNGGGGAVVYGDIGGSPGVGPLVNLFGGADNIVTIGAFSFVANFDTNANTTCNNLIAAVAANVPADALYVGVLDSGQAVFSVRAKGVAGNLVRVSNFGAGYDPQTFAWYTTVAKVVPTNLMSGGTDGLITKGCPNIQLCTIPPFGTNPGYTAGKDTQRNNLNTTIRAYVAAGVTIYDLDVLVRDGGAHQNTNPAYDAGDGSFNNAGHLAVKTDLIAFLP